VTKFVYVTGQGRSGSLFLATLLNQAKNATIYHEPLNDALPYSVSTKSEAQAKNFASVRSRWIKAQAKKVGTPIFGEVNSFLRRTVPHFKGLLGPLLTFHLVRDGRDVVRSMVSRNVLGGDFTAVCRYWGTEVEYVSRYVKTAIRLEDLLSGYPSFRKHILEPTGIKLDEYTWTSMKKEKLNKCYEYTIPSWDDWDAKQRTTFKLYCGKMMLKFGYWK